MSTKSKLNPSPVTPWPDISCHDLSLHTEAASSYNPDWINELFDNQTEQSKRFLEPVPKDILEMVMRFPCCRLPLLAYAGRNQDKFVRLGFQSPALLFSLAFNYWTSNKRVLIGKNNQRTLWSELRYPGNRSFARQMARLPFHKIRPNTVPTLATRWRHSSLFRRMFRHVSYMNDQVIDCLLGLHEDRLHPWVLSVAENFEGQPFRVGATVNLLYINWRQLHPLKQPNFGNIRDFRTLERAYWRTEHTLRDSDFFFSEDYQHAFPPPPVPGSDLIIPMTHPEHLGKEAESKKNCLKRYVVPIYSKRAYAYRCPSRDLSILLEKDASGRWRLAAVERGQNTTASADDLTFVRAWLREKGIS
jgi:hypothetical protein